jgi:1-acyl-sn-glycerol-3-phosphate acyltransferase
MKGAWLAVRSLFFWTISWIHFFIGVIVLIPCGMLIDPLKIDGIVRFFTRNVMRFAGAHVSVRFAPGFDQKRTCFFAANHTNLFDPFVLNSVVPQHVRGLELESHFRIPLYGILMKRFGNVPVPNVRISPGSQKEFRNPSELKRMLQQTKKALDSGTSLIVFPEGTRTSNGRIGKIEDDEFEDGGFRMAIQFGYPIVPISVVGSFEFNRKNRWWLHPSNIVVHIHDTIETKGLRKEDVPELRDRVRAIMCAPVDKYYEERELSENN